jgi:hypothetical protein
MGPEHRAKIANSQILRVLIAGAEGKRKLNPAQAQVGIALLKKVMPDMAQVQLTGDEDNPVAVVHKIERVIVRPED